jgi:uncharacterized protein YjbI with pentapeptide repeats
VPIELTEDRRKRLREAMVSAFGDFFRLEMFFADELGVINIGAQLPSEQPFAYKCYYLIQLMERAGDLERLCHALKRNTASAGNQRLQEIVNELMTVSKSHVPSEHNERQFFAGNRLFPNRDSASSDTGGTFSLVWNVPYPRNPQFTGRGDVIARLAAELSSGSATAVTQAIAGLGGIGKTQLSLEYCYRHRDSYKIIWWIRAENKETRLTDLMTLGKRLAVPDIDNANETAAVRRVIDWLDRTPGWLLVFDNVEDPSHLTGLLPTSGGGHILITSRYASWGGKAKAVTLDVWNAEEASNYLLMRTAQAATPENKEAATELADALGRLPLAIEQAAAYIDDTQMGLIEYTRLFSKQKLRLLQAGHSQKKRDEQTVATVWEISLRSVERASPGAVALLKLCAFLRPDQIAKETIQKHHKAMFEPLRTTATDAVALHDAIAVLRRYSLVDATEHFISVHRVVQLVVGERLKGRMREYVQFSELARRLESGVDDSQYLDEQPRPIFLGALIDGWKDLVGQKRTVGTSRNLGRTGWFTRRNILEAAGAVAIVGVALAYFAYRSIYEEHLVPRFTPAAIQAIKSDSTPATTKESNLRWLAKYHRQIDATSATLRGLDLQRIVARALPEVGAPDIRSGPVFENARIFSVDFSSSWLANAAFTGSRIVDTKFTDANMVEADFYGSVLMSSNVSGGKATDFKDANLSRARFDGSRFCGKLSFAASDVRDVSFQNVAFEGHIMPDFSRSAWWLAKGWSREQRRMLAEQARPADLEETKSFKDLLLFHDRQVAAVRLNDNLERAGALNNKAWALAIRGVRLAEAKELVEQALNLLNANDRNQRQLSANIQDTLAYILMETNQIDQARQTLSRIADIDPSFMFHYAVALAAGGNTDEAIEKLKLAMGKGRYLPTHELYLFRNYIESLFKDQVDALMSVDPTAVTSATCDETLARFKGRP